MTGRAIESYTIMGSVVDGSSVIGSRTAEVIAQSLTLPGYKGEVLTEELLSDYRAWVWKLYRENTFHR